MKLSGGALSLLTVLLIFALLGAGVVWRLLDDNGDSGTNQTSTELPETAGIEVDPALQFAGAQPVAVEPVLRDTLWIHLSGSGEAVANRRSEVATRAAGVVQEVFVQENDMVSEGDILIQLDTSEVSMEVAQAEWSLLSAEADFRERMLLDSDTASLRRLGLIGPGGVVDRDVMAERERIARVMSGLNQAELNLEQARMRLEWTRVRAPFSGRVANLQAVEGSYLGTGAQVLTLLELDPIRIHVEAIESMVPFLARGRRAVVRFTAFPGEFEARVHSINPEVDSDARSARLTLVMPNPDHRILPGMWTRVLVEATDFPDRILVPRDAVVERGERRPVVFVARNLNDNLEGITEWRYVTLGERNESYFEIVPHPETQMLEPGEFVLVDGHQYIGHDVAIRIVENVAAEGGVVVR